MNNLLAKVILITALPIAVFSAGVFLMSKLSHGESIHHRLLQLPDPRDQKPLNQRIRGYDANAVSRHWGALDERALWDQRHALEIDLVFPLLYGAAFLASLLLAWVSLGRPFNFAWLVAPVGITILADWTENSFQLLQLRDFMAARLAGRVPCIQPSCIQIASAATVVKLICIGGITIFLAVLLAFLVERSIKHMI